MKKYLLVLSVLLSTANLHAVKPDYVGLLEISFDKSLHLVFRENVKYVDAAPGITASVIPSLNNIVKVTCNEENFTGLRNLSVVTWDGEFHSYHIIYRDQTNFLTYFDNPRDSLNKETISVCNDKSSHVLFPSKIIYYDCGNDSTITYEKTIGNNILKMRSLSPAILPTNMFVVTEDKKIYELQMKNDSDAVDYTYYIGGEKTKATFDNTANDIQIKKIAEKCLSISRRITSVGEQKNDLICSLNNIHINNDILFFTFKIANTSPIRMSIDLLHCFLRDEKTLADQPEQDTEMSPLLTYNYKNEIDANSEQVFVLAFPKFTIPDKKKFHVQILDKDGGRHLSFNIKNNFIIRAKHIN